MLNVSCSRLAVFSFGAYLVTVLVMPLHAQPETPIRPVVDVYHGVSVSDPYRWLEDDSSDEVRQWSAAQNAHSRTLLDALPGVATLRGRISQIMSHRSPRYWNVRFRSGRYFAMMDQPPKQQPMLIVLSSPDDVAAARVIVDPNALDSGGGTAIDWYEPSPDGRLVAVSLSRDGTEAGDVHVFDVATGREVHEVVPHASSGTAGGSLAWAADASGFFYTRHPWPGERPDADRGFYQQVYFHQLGTQPRDDRYELGRALPRIAEIKLQADYPSGRVIASVQNGDGGEFAHYYRDPETRRWQQFAQFQDRIVQVAFGKKDDLFLISFAGAPRGQIQRIPLLNLGRATPQTIVREEEHAIVTSFFEPSTFAATENRFYAVYQLGGPTELRVFDYRYGWKLRTPEQLKTANVYQVEPLGGDKVLFGNSSYLEPPAFYTFDATEGETKKTALASESPVDFRDIQVVREFAVSKDGTQVPVNILYRTGTPLDGSSPCVATAYGGYGISVAPSFRAVDRVLFDHGFVLAEANIRGGGEFGEQWHREGNLTQKQNVFDDFAAVLKHLIDRKYTSRERLGIVGGSNGGLLMGAIITQHPDLVQAVVSHVGIYDSLRTELSPNGEFNVTEFGTVKDADQFRALYAYSPYHRVSDGARYPAILFMTGENDPRVEPMQSRKMTARLQAAAAAGSGPILLRTSSGGHGGDTPLDERIAQTVDEFAFFMRYLGVSPSQDP